jgi:hypothetical protein
MYVDPNNEKNNPEKDFAKVFGFSLEGAVEVDPDNTYQIKEQDCQQGIYLPKSSHSIVKCNEGTMENWEAIRAQNSINYFTIPAVYTVQLNGSSEANAKENSALLERLRESLFESSSGYVNRRDLFSDLGITSHTDSE